MEKFYVSDHEYSLLPEGKKWKLVWNDEFDGTVLDENKWGFRLNYWGERFKAYTDKGVQLDGKGNIEFFPVLEDGLVKSSQLQTGVNGWDNLDILGNVKKRQDFLSGKRDFKEGEDSIKTWPLRPLPKCKFTHRYGYYEARVRFQKYSFWWSAFWIQSPSIGISAHPEFSGVECDIIEKFKADELTSGNIYGGYAEQFTESARVRYPYQEDGEFHRVGVEWSPQGYIFYLDGKETARSSGPVSQIEQFILLTTEAVSYTHLTLPTT